MKTRIRIIKDIRQNSYSHLEFQILSPQWRNEKYLEYVGSITWQSNCDTPYDWYAMNFVVRTDKHEDLSEMLKIAKLIRAMHGNTPDEVFKILEGVEYFLFEGLFIKKSDIGSSLFLVMKGDSHKTYIIAPNEVCAERTLKLDKEHQGCYLKFKSIIK